jgi:hypothetical protein
MTTFVEKFLVPLIERDWSCLTDSHRFLESLLENLNARRDWLRDEFKSHSCRERFSKALASREPSTHFKWLMFRDSNFRFEVWLHEYKSKELLKPGYAVVPHNHVYQFSSLILSGGFKHISYEVCRSREAESTFDALRVSGERVVSKNMIYTLTADHIHSLSEIQEGTTTLVVNSASLKPFSEEFNLEDRRIIKHYPLPVRIRESYPFLDRI